MNRLTERERREVRREAETRKKNLWHTDKESEIGRCEKGLIKVVTSLTLSSLKYHCQLRNLHTLNMFAFASFEHVFVDLRHYRLSPLPISSCLEV